MRFLSVPLSFSEEEQKKQQTEAYLLVIAKLGRALERSDGDHGELQRLGGTEKVIELCEDKMMQLPQSQDPWRYLNRQEALNELQRRFGDEPQTEPPLPDGFTAPHPGSYTVPVHLSLTMTAGVTAI